MTIYAEAIDLMQECIDEGTIYGRPITADEIKSFRRAIEILRKAEEVEE
jgi:hypothetical protein